MLLSLLAPPTVARAASAQEIPVVDLRTVALSGDPAPGAPAGTVFESLFLAKMDGQARVAFYATVSGPAITAVNDDGIWSERNGPLELVMMERDPAPGTDGALFSDLVGAFSGMELGIDPDGNVFFQSYLVGGDVAFNPFGFPVNHSGYWSWDGAELRLLVRGDDPVPGAPPSILHDTVIGRPEVNRAGDAVMYFVTKGSGGAPAPFAQVIRMGDALGFDPVSLAVGDPIPGLDPTLAIARVDDVPKISPHTDAYTIHPTIAGPGVTFQNDDVLVASRNGPLELIFREGDAAPGGGFFGPGPTVTSKPVQNHSVHGGETFAFHSRLHGLPGGITDAVFLEANGEIELVAREGEPAPGLAPGTTFHGFGFQTTNGPMALNDARQMAFFARVRLSSAEVRESLWFRDADGTVRPIAVEGDPPPGAAPGVVFGKGEIFILSVFGPPALTRHGNVLFSARLEGLPGTSTAFAGIYLFQPQSGAFEKLVAAGDRFDVATSGGDVREVAAASLGGDALGVVLDDGTFLFDLSFEDGTSGLFTQRLDEGELCQPDLGFGGPGSAALELCGQGLAGGESSTLRLEGGAPLQAALVFGAPSVNPLPLAGGFLVPNPPTIAVGVVLDAGGGFSIPVRGGGGPLTLYLQVAFVDPDSPTGIGFSNTVAAAFLP